MSLMGLDASVISKDNSKSRQNRHWIANEEVIALPSAFGVNLSDIFRLISRSLQESDITISQEKLSNICWSILESPYVIGLSGRSALGENGAVFGTAGLLRIWPTYKGWGPAWESQDDSPVGAMVFMPDTGAIRCFRSSLPRVEKDLPSFHNLGDCLKKADSVAYIGCDHLAEVTAPLSLIKLYAFPKDAVSGSLISSIMNGMYADERLSMEQTQNIIAPLLTQLEHVSRNISDSLCGKLIPFAKEIVKRGESLELNAYNFTTTAGTDSEKVYIWAKAQYQPLITLLQRMQPKSLVDLVAAISDARGEDEINGEMARLFKCSAHLISVLRTARPDDKQLSLVVTRGLSGHLTDSYKGLNIGHSVADKRSILHRLMSVYSNLDDKGAEKLNNILEGAKKEELSLEQVAFSLLCTSVEDNSKDPVVPILLRLLREINGGKSVSCSDLDKVRSLVRDIITDLEASMVRPLMSEKKGYIKALGSQIDGQNLPMNEMVQKITRQLGVEPGDYPELARAFCNRSVEDIILDWPLGEPFSKQASKLAYCLAIMGGMDSSEIAPFLLKDDDKKGKERGREYLSISKSDSILGIGRGSRRYFFKSDNDDSWHRLMQVGFNGRVCKISPQPVLDHEIRDAEVLHFTCQIFDPTNLTLIGTLALKVKRKGEAYEVVTDKVRLGNSFSDSFDQDGKLPQGYDILGPDIRAFVDGLNSQKIDPELFQRIGEKVEEFKVALSWKIHEVVTRLHPEPLGGFGAAIATAHTRLSKIFPWLNDLPTMWNLTKDVNRLMD
jgi:hypothetical protein